MISVDEARRLALAGHGEGDGPEARALVVIGCGNLLRGDDGVGPVCIRHLWETPGGVPDGVVLVDGGTAGMDVAFKMQGARRVILVDAAATGAEPGTVYRVPGEELEALPPLEGLHTHSFRWDHALAFGRWLLADRYPDDITVYLIEIAGADPGADLTPPVTAAMHRVADLIRAEWPTSLRSGEPAPAGDLIRAERCAERGEPGERRS